MSSTNSTVKTWRDRLGLGDAYPLHAPTDVERAMVAEIAELRATPSTAAGGDLVRMVDAAMVEMVNIHPPLRRKECERLIRAALDAVRPAPDEEPSNA